MRIDAHQHYWTLARGDYGWLTPALAPIHRDFGPPDLAPLLAGCGIGRTIVVQAAPTESETAYLLEIAACTPSVAGVVGWSDFEAADAGSRIAALARNPLLVGLRPMIQDIADDAWMLRPQLHSAFAAMRECGLVFDALVKPRHLLHLDLLCARHRGLRVVIDHCAKPEIAARRLDPWRQDMTLMARHAHVSVKLSGLVTEAGQGWTADHLAPYVAHVLSAFGAQRVLWGSDWPVLELAGDYAGWRAVSDGLLSSLSEAERADVYGLNAARVYLSGRGRR